MNSMESRWVVKEKSDERVVKHLSEVLSIDGRLAILLAQRGITTYDEAKDFFRPDLSQLHDPFLMKDMDKAIERIIAAHHNNEKVLVYGDYDVDGTTAVALVYSYLKKFFKKRIEFYIPDRYQEGYGISKKGVDHAAKHGFNLVIVLDCGIKAIERIQYANEKNIDFIICDHHRPGDELPNAVAVLDSKREDCDYPFKELSGCGVGFKLISAFALKMNEPIESVYEYLDLVAISIAADIVPITGENRILAYYGLRAVNKNPRPGIEAVLHHVNVFRREDEDENEQNVLTRELTISDLVFMIGPRINAAGRIEKASDSVRLLLADKKSHAEKLAQSINDLNNTRREFDTQITEEALLMIYNDPQLLQAKSTVIFNENWHKGVIGIVASRLTDTYYRPTIVLTRSNGVITGSARSIKNFDVYDAIDHCSDLLLHFGGHKYAAGLSLPPENLEAFKERFNDYVEKHIEETMLVPEIEIDLELNFSDITPKFLRILKQFAPFGPGNMAPTFKTTNVVDTGLSRTVGNHKHIKLAVRQNWNIAESFAGIAFHKGDFYEKIRSGQPFSICYHIEENEWQGKVNLQLNVKDIKFEK